jgi:uncharacterized protein
MNFKKINIVFGFIVLMIQMLQAQNNFILVGTKQNNTTILRWACLNTSHLKQAYINGYTIQKLNPSNLAAAPLTEITIKPLAGNAPQLQNTSNPYLQAAKKVADNYQLLDDPKNNTVDGRLSQLAADLDTNAASAMGLIYRTIESGNYAYCIVIKNGTSILAKSNVLMSNAIVASAMPSIGALKVARNAKRVDIAWSIANLGTAYAYYNVERSTNANTGFMKLNDLPVIRIKSKGTMDKKERNDLVINFKDTTLQEGTTYYYRVVGQTVFGEQGAYSPVLKYKMLRTFKTLIALNDIQIKSGKGLSLSWQLTVPEEEKYIASYSVLKKENAKDQFKAIATGILPPLKSYIDAKSIQQNFHQIAAITIDNDTIFSSQKMTVVYDTIPPEIPSGLAGVIATDGTLKLTWKANTEKDMKGYIIYRANAVHEELIEVNNKLLPKSEYSEKLPLQNLTEDIYFAVSAVDNSYNTSQPSAILKLKKPDKIAPSAAVLKNYQAFEGYIDLHISGSNSKDVAAYEIQRKVFSKDKKANTAYATVATIKAKDSLHFRDKSCAPFTAYYYKVMTKDDDGNTSESQDYYIQSLDVAPIEAEITDLRFDATSKQVVLKWTTNLMPAPKFVLVYKQTSAHPYQFYKSLNYLEGQMNDESVENFGTSTYRIKFKYSEEKYSTLSKEKTIRIN